MLLDRSVLEEELLVVFKIFKCSFNLKEMLTETQPSEKKGGTQPFREKDGTQPFREKDGTQPFREKDGTWPFREKCSTLPHLS
jgi:hypothetical protein